MPRLIFNGDNPPVTPWVRPADWLPLPNVLSSEQKMVGLVAIFDTDSEFLAFTATGNFTVDWGDGSATENINSGVTAQHKYTYSSISSSTLCSRGYKQSIVTITPQLGQNFDSVLINKRHSSASPQAQGSGWLDITCSCRATSTSGFSTNDTGTLASLLEQCTILNGGSRTNCSYMFYQCNSLQSVPLFDTSAVTNMTGMFFWCYLLQSVPLFDTSAVTNMTSMFYQCSSLQSVPLFDTSAVTNMTSMLSRCNTLQFVPLFDTSAVTNMTSMFEYCYLLQSVPLFDTSAVTNMSYFLYSCRLLTIVPAFNLSVLTTTTQMFFTCVTISRAFFSGLGANFSLLNLNLSGLALDEIYTNLPTVTGKTITVTGNYGTATHTPSIATAKGWTVTV